jgi:hypothetical protein
VLAFDRRGIRVWILWWLQLYSERCLNWRFKINFMSKWSLESVDNCFYLWNLCDRLALIRYPICFPAVRIVLRTFLSGKMSKESIFYFNTRWRSRGNFGQNCIVGVWRNHRSWNKSRHSMKFEQNMDHHSLDPAAWTAYFHYETGNWFEESCQH